MSIWIPCPHCGPRPLEEFVHGEIPIASHTTRDPDEGDLDRAFMHSNPDGPTTERWFHVSGCRRWLTVRRDTRTDLILPPGPV
jgi:heterotetrameric sarcosine oxidase delta subunit